MNKIKIYFYSLDDCGPAVTNFLTFLTIAFYLAELLGCKKEDPWALVRKLEAQLAQEKFFHEKTKTDHQYEVKVKSRLFKNTVAFQFYSWCLREQQYVLRGGCGPPFACLVDIFIIKFPRWNPAQMSGLPGTPSHFFSQFDRHSQTCSHCFHAAKKLLHES